MDLGPQPAFRLERNDQQDSAFIQLPKELRLDILRMLLRKDGHLTTFVVTADNICLFVHLSPCVLSLCQALYDEAYHILYQENTIPVYFMRWHRTSSKLMVCIFDSTFTTRDEPDKTFPYPFCAKRTSFDLNRYEHFSLKGRSDSLMILARFKNVHISFVRDASYLVASRALASLVRNKSVVIDLGNSALSGSDNPHWPYNYSHWSSGNVYRPHLAPACFATWKCQSIEFQNGCHRGCCISEYAELARIITDEKLHVRDLCADLWRLDDALTQALPFNWRCGPSILDQLDIHRDALVYAIHNSDVHTFNRTRQRVMITFLRVISEYEIRATALLEDTALYQILDVEEHHGLDEEERTIWLDQILSTKEHETARVRRQAEDSKSLLYELVDEDELLNEEVSHDFSGEITMLDRVFSLPQMVFTRGSVWQRYGSARP